MAIGGYNAAFFKQGAFVPLRRYDPQLFGSKSYRDSVLSSNVIRKATQLVAQIEAAGKQSKTNPIQTILANARGKGFDFRA